MSIRFSFFWLVFLSTSVQAELVQLSWTQDGRFEHEAQLLPSEFLEVCGALDEGDEVAWALRSAAPLDFNIHYHADDEVVYPAEESDATELQSTLLVPLDQTYCWMLTNPGGAAVRFTLSLSHGPG